LTFRRATLCRKCQKDCRDSREGHQGRERAQHQQGQGLGLDSPGSLGHLEDRKARAGNR